MNRREFIKQSVVAAVCVSPVGRWLYEKWKNRIPVVELQMSSTPIIAKTRKLKAIWTIEAQQDLEVYHGVHPIFGGFDDEAIARAIEEEIDNAVLEDLINDSKRKTRSRRKTRRSVRRFAARYAVVRNQGSLHARRLRNL